MYMYFHAYHWEGVCLVEISRRCSALSGDPGLHSEKNQKKSHRVSVCMYMYVGREGLGACGRLLTPTLLAADRPTSSE